MLLSAYSYEDKQANTAFWWRENQQLWICLWTWRSNFLWMLNKQVFSFCASSYFLRGNWSIENDPKLCLSNAEAEVATSPATSISYTLLNRRGRVSCCFTCRQKRGTCFFFFNRLLCLYGLWDISTFFLNHENKDSARAKPALCLTEIGLFIQWPCLNQGPRLLAPEVITYGSVKRTKKNLQGERIQQEKRIMKVKHA